MKKHLFCLLAATMLLLGLCVSASAYESAHIFDTAELLSDSEGDELESLCQQAEDQYGCGIYVVTVDDYSLYYSADSIEDFSESVFLDLGFGAGEDHNGILLALSMAERDFDLAAHGTIGNRAFTDYGKERLQQEFLDNFRNDDWYGGLHDYAAEATWYLELDADDTPLDIGSDSEVQETVSGGKILIVVLVPLLTALIVCLIMKGKMKSARKKTQADEYIPHGGIRMTRQDDLYLTTTQTRVKVVSENESSGGTSVNSSGFSHSSGKF